ncbi:MAG: response regulator transcription factor [Chloroflexi bacterium]|nr:response regulator transcription factor [Chloroflexota bacterium]
MTTDAPKIKILIVDDHPMVRHGLRRILEREKDMEVIGEAADGLIAVTEAQRLMPQIVLMDVSLPGMNGLQATREIRQIDDGPSVIVLTAYINDAQFLHALRAGAAACYAKEVMPHELIGAIRMASQGQFIIEGNAVTEKQAHAWLLQKLAALSSASVDFPEDSFVPLSSREMEILQQIGRGQSNKEIAKELGISRQTVKNHMTSILRKLSVEDRTQAALYALRQGWIRLEDTV